MASRFAFLLALAACSDPAGPAAVDAAQVDAPGSDGTLDDATPDSPIDAAPTNFTDGICAAGPVGAGVHDPDCIYLIGTTLPGSAGRDVLVELGAPAAYSYGFGYYADGGVIRHTDGRLVFSDSNGESRGFTWVPDATPGSSPVPSGAMLVNDGVIATPACTLGMYRAMVFPDDGVVAYRCYRSSNDPASDGNRLFLEGETTVFAAGGDESPVGLGAGRSVLFAGTNTMSVWATGQTTAVAIGTYAGILAVRFRDDRFLVAVARSYSPTIVVELASISRAGAFTSLGTYNLGNVQSYFDDCKLEPTGTLVCFSYENTSDDTVTRFSTSAPPATIYDERLHPVQIHISSLATGS